MRTVGKPLVVLLFLGVTLALGPPAHAIGIYHASLGTGVTLVEPPQTNPKRPAFSIFTYVDSQDDSRQVALNGIGFYQDDPAKQTMESAFAGQDFTGVLTSEVWQYRGVDGEGDGHLLFLYQVENTTVGGRPGWDEFSTVSVFGGHWGSHVITDAGMILPTPPADDAIENLSKISRLGADVLAGSLEDPVCPGESSAWFYFETDAKNFAFGEGQVTGLTHSVSDIPTFAPAPEPITALALASGLIGLGGYIRRRTSKLR